MAPVIELGRARSGGVLDPKRDRAEERCVPAWREDLHKGDLPRAAPTGFSKSRGGNENRIHGPLL